MASKIALTDRERLDQLLYRLRRGETDVFNDVVGIFERWKNFQRYCERRSKRFDIITLDGDDLYQIALMTILDRVMMFKFLCPYCDERFEKKVSFLNHVFVKHDSDLFIPRVSIGDYISMSVYNETRNAIKIERAEKRFMEPEAIIIDPESIRAIDVDPLANLRVSQLLTLAREELEERTFIILQMIASGYSKTDVAEKLVVEEYYGSRNSALVSIGRILKRRSKLLLNYLDSA